MNPKFFKKIETALATERIDAYRKDGVPPVVALARYLWNMALCESLYSPLQIAEIALRNALHRCLSAREGTANWYDSIVGLPEKQKSQIDEARKKLQREKKQETPGRMVAEFHFGFWTSFFNKYHAGSGIGHTLSKQAFSFAPRSQRDQKNLDTRLTLIRDLRNRVFHHERIIHWEDLDAQHVALLELIGWLSPELRDMALALDRYTLVQKAGIDPWLTKLRRHWPDPSNSPTETAAVPVIVPVSEILDASSGVDTPFGKRRGGDVFAMNDQHLDTLLDEEILALDVQSEYVIYLKYLAQPPSVSQPAALTPPEQANSTNHKELGYGG